MKCNACGNEITDDSKFCTSCGAPVEPAPPASQPASATQAASMPKQTSAPQPVPIAQQPSVKPRNKLAIPLTIAAIVIVALIVVLAVVLLMPAKDEPAPSTDAGTTAQPAATVPTFENDVFRITLPADVADKVTFQTGTHLDVVYMYSRQRSDLCLAEILPQNQASEYSGEAAHTVYSLGEVDLAGYLDEAIMDLIYIDANGSTIYMGRPESAALPVMTGLEKYLGMTPDEFAACIEIKTANGFARSMPRCLSNGDFPQKLQEKKNSSSAVPSSAFWGIWAQASKDKSEAEAAAQRIRNDYGLDAFVVLTTDWSNLNSEPWYCVSIGSYASQDAANAALSQARAANPDAYVKYSGNKK